MYSAQMAPTTGTSWARPELGGESSYGEAIPLGLEGACPGSSVSGEVLVTLGSLVSGVTPWAPSHPHRMSPLSVSLSIAFLSGGSDTWPESPEILP